MLAKACPNYSGRVETSNSGDACVAPDIDMMIKSEEQEKKTGYQHSILEPSSVGGAIDLMIKSEEQEKKTGYQQSFQVSP